MEKFITAFATDNEKSFTNNHFGDADCYMIYEISLSDVKFIKKISNTSEEEDEEIHADPKKAKSVAKMLKNENVNVVVSRIYGPNINRIKKKFVCVLMDNEEISECPNIIQKKLNVIIDEWNKGEDRNYLNFRGEKNEDLNK